MLLLLSTIFYVPIGKIHARLSREREREREGRKDRERGLLGTWHSGERFEIQLSNLQDITGFPLECTLLPNWVRGEGGQGGVADTKILV